MRFRKHRFALERPKPWHCWRTNPPAQPGTSIIGEGHFSMSKPKGRAAPAFSLFSVRKSASITYLGKMLQKLQTKCLNLHAMWYCAHLAGSSVHLKPPNSRSEDDNHHLIISESIETPAWKNTELQMDSKMQKKGFSAKCWESKE